MHERAVLGRRRGPDGACWDVFCDDPTAVVHVVVHDVEGTGGYFVGQWITTVKHLVLAPTSTGTTSARCSGGRVRRRGVRGWSPLRRLATISPRVDRSPSREDRPEIRFRSAPNHPQARSSPTAPGASTRRAPPAHLLGRRVDGAPGEPSSSCPWYRRPAERARRRGRRDEAEPPPPRARSQVPRPERAAERGAGAAEEALERLQENSDETSLRLGDARAVLKMLHHFPLLFDFRWFVVNNVEFFLEDLFMGSAGQAERGGLHRMRAIELEQLDLRHGLGAPSTAAAGKTGAKPGRDDEGGYGGVAAGVALDELCKHLVLKIIPPVLKEVDIMSGAGQIIAGLLVGLVSPGAARGAGLALAGGASGGGADGPGGGGGGGGLFSAVSGILGGVGRARPRAATRTAPSRRPATARARSRSRATSRRAAAAARGASTSSSSASSRRAAAAARRSPRARAGRRRRRAPRRALALRAARGGRGRRVARAQGARAAGGRGRAPQRRGRARRRARRARARRARARSS